MQWMEPRKSGNVFYDFYTTRWNGEWETPLNSIIGEWGICKIFTPRDGMGNSIIGEWGICKIFTPRDGMGNSIIGEWGICKIFTPRDGMGTP